MATASHPHDAVRWHCHYRVDKYHGPVSWDDIRRGARAYDFAEGDGNLLMTAGATALFNGLVTAGLATPFNSTNAQIVVGDASTASTAADTDLGAVAGASLGGGITAATNATPIVLTTSTAHGRSVGEVVLVAGVGGNTAANNTFEVSAVGTSTTLTLLNSAGNGAYTSGGTVKLINKYRQLVNGAPAVSTNTCQFVSVFGTANANFAWAEWGVCTGGAATNKQAAPPPTLLNHAVVSLGTKTSAATWTFTVTLSLS